MPAARRRSPRARAAAARRAGRTSAAPTSPGFPMSAVRKKAGLGRLDGEAQEPDEPLKGREEPRRRAAAHEYGERPAGRRLARARRSPGEERERGEERKGVQGIPVAQDSGGQRGEEERQGDGEGATRHTRSGLPGRLRAGRARPEGETEEDERSASRLGEELGLASRQGGSEREYEEREGEGDEGLRAGRGGREPRRGLSDSCSASGRRIASRRGLVESRRADPEDGAGLPARRRSSTSLPTATRGGSPTSGRGRRKSSRASAARATSRSTFRCASTGSCATGVAGRRGCRSFRATSSCGATSSTSGSSYSRRTSA